MKSDSDITAFIIAGGRSRRFGSDKLLHEYRGRPVIKYAVDTLSAVFREIVIIANDTEKFSFLGLPVCADIIQGIGPAGGLYTALECSKTEKTFCFAGDMPNIDPRFVKYMTAISGDYDVVVPGVGNNYYEALHAIYSKRCMAFLKDNISKGDYKIINLFPFCSTRKIEQAEIEANSDKRDLFKNINYINDIE